MGRERRSITESLTGQAGNGIAKALVDNMANEVGEDASFAIVTSTFTTPNQARWISAMSA